MLDNLQRDGESEKNSEAVRQEPGTQHQSLFGRLLGTLRSTFVSDAATPPPLAGRRFQESTDKQANKILDHFLIIAQKLETHLDDHELATYVQTAMDSIKRDYHRIQKKAAHSPTKQNEQILHEWMRKAKGWIELDAKLHDRAAIINAVIRQQFSTLDELIDQDLQLIFDYETHILSDLPITLNEKGKLEQVILAHLTPHTQALIKLKEHPPKLELHKVAQWKENIDRTRGLYFEKALHAIDAIVGTLSPVSIGPKESNQLLEATGLEIAHLQQGTKELFQEALRLIPEYETGRKKIESTLLLLDQQTHLLSGNLQLTHELFEQLQEIQRELEQIRTMISQD